MSKVSDNKNSQGYTKILNTCSNCNSFTCATVKANYGYGNVEKNLRCSLGGFKVNKTATCNKHTKI